MLDQQRVSAASTVGEAIARELDMVEFALATGDVAAAQRRLRRVKRSLHGDVPEPSANPIVGGVALTGQELASLRLLPDGSLCQKDIARAMGVTRNTLKTHLKSLYLKLGVHCRSEAIHRARELGLLPQPLSIVATLPTDEVAVA